MSRDTLWAPWRLDYVLKNKEAGDPKPSCFLCKAVDESNDRVNLLAHRGTRAMVILNRFPYNNGHLMVAPMAHKASLEEVDEQEVGELFKLITLMKVALDQILQPDGYNIGLNLGKVAGAGLPGHLHWHIVPRWNGDTNFMPVLADSRVIVQSLESLYDLLTEQLASI